MNNITLLAVPLFIFMGTVLEKSGIAAKMLENMAAALKLRVDYQYQLLLWGLPCCEHWYCRSNRITMGLMSYLS